MLVPGIAAAPPGDPGVSTCIPGRVSPCVPHRGAAESRPGGRQHKPGV